MTFQTLRQIARRVWPGERHREGAAPADTGQILLERKDGLATVILYNPNKLNALSIRMWETLGETFRAFSADLTLRCILIRGADGNFAAGADIAQFPTERMTHDQVHRYHNETIGPALRAIAECLHPTVALIEGFCVGGGLEIASQCDLRVAASGSRLGAPIKKLGFAMAPEELRRIVAIAGRAVASELLLEGRILSAGEARERGLVTRVVADENVEEEAYATAARIAEGAPIAARLNKKLIRRLCPEPAALTPSEIDEFFSFIGTHDHQEGIAAFLEKRSPKFRGS